MSKNSKNKNEYSVFDEENLGSGIEDFGSMLERSFAVNSKRFEKGDKVEAEIVTIGKENTFVVIGGKEGVVLTKELKDSEGNLTAAVGEKITLYVTKYREDLIELSVKASSKALAEGLEDAFDFETPVDGKVVEVVNGGFRVEIMGKLAFCPISQIDLKQAQDPANYIGKKFEFIITKFEEKGRNIVVSRRRVLEAEQVESQGQFLDKAQVGDEVTGKVTRLEQFGAFVELSPGVEGLVHISELGWSRVAHPSEVVSVGDVITAKILKLEEDDRGRLKISLSRKQAEASPWEKLTFHVGDQVDCKLKEKAHFGYLVELIPGIVGLLPKSALKEAPADMNLEKKNPGDVFKLQIQRIDQVEKRISLMVPKNPEDESWREYAPSVSSSQKTSFGTLGDQLKNFQIKK